MKFLPYKDKVEIKPINNNLILSVDSAPEKGEVVAVGAGVTEFSVGDVIHFLAYGCSESESADGEKHFTVSVNEQVVLGKEPKEIV